MNKMLEEKYDTFKAKDILGFRREEEKHVQQLQWRTRGSKKTSRREMDTGTKAKKK